MASSGNKYFSVVAFFVLLRETIEASVIVAVVLQCLNKTLPRMKRQVWWGVAIGFLMCVLFGVGFIVAYYAASEMIFTGNSKLIFNGTIALVASIIITALGFAMLRFMGMEKKWRKKLERKAIEASTAAETVTASRKAKYGVFFLVFTTIIREGIESVVFLAGVGSASPTSIPLAGVAGIVTGVVIGVAIYYTGKSVKDMKWFFIISTVILFFIAAGQVSIGTNNLMLAGAFGTYSTWSDERQVMHRPLWDISKCCNDLDNTQNPFFPLARALVGYQDKPTPVEVIMYCSYWVIVIAILLWKWWKGTLFGAPDEDQEEERMEGPDVEASSVKDVEVELPRAVQIVNP